MVCESGFMKVLRMEPGAVVTMYSESACSLVNTNRLLRLMLSYNLATLSLRAGAGCWVLSVLSHTHGSITTPLITASASVSTLHPPRSTDKA
uniref:Uncharacterized protein n=1 Tax=Knipowitschia caucasica TaxID=637954 RepID=A0AAV2KMI0_KNICA